MDNGEEIPGLGDSWTFLGAKPFEWIAGLPTFMIISEMFFKGATVKWMPILLLCWFATTFVLAGMRRRFPDEERGLLNLLAVKCGFAPPNIPTPAELQPLWSGAPLRHLSEKCEFHELGLADVFEVGYMYAANGEDHEQGITNPAAVSHRKNSGSDKAKLKDEE